MGFSLDRVVPWGRNFSEYAAMFSLTGPDLKKAILGCGDGPASFNKEASALGGRVVSVDPLYQFGPLEIKTRIAATFDQIMHQTRKNRHEFVWKSIASPKDLGRLRMAAMEDFLTDFSAGKPRGRYVCGQLPVLPFPDKAFDLSLCSHFFFLYSGRLSLDFHIRSIMELCRVAKQTRVFPLLELGAKPSRHLSGVVSALKNQGYAVKEVRVDYEFVKGGNRMLACSAPGR